MDYGDLRHKTPLDFTSDKKILEDIGLDPDDPWTIRILQTMNDTTRANFLIDYAEHESVSDDDLREAVYAEFDAEFSARENGLIFPEITKEDMKLFEDAIAALKK